jgi:outer membrane protein TolC
MRARGCPASSVAALVGGAVLAFTGALAAAQAPDAAPLPQPLTLDQALDMAAAAHPDRVLAEAALDEARAGVLEADAFSGFRAYVDLTAQSTDFAAEPGHDFVDDSRMGAVISKRLYDFGRSRALRESAQATVAGREQRLFDNLQQRRLEIMARFFDVLLADLRFAVDNETMAQRYVRFDKARDRHELGEVSLIDLRELESVYQDALIVRSESDRRQRASRARLAVALNRPDDLPAELLRPALPGNDRDAPDYEQLLTEALERNPVLAALRDDVAAARSAVAAERSRGYPVVSGEIAYYDYEREIGSREEYKASLNLRIPIYQGGEDDAAIARASARLAEREAKLAKAEHEMRQTVLDLVQRIEVLRIARNAARVRVDYRDLYLDRAQGKYELEMETTLGDAMSRLTEAQWMAEKVEFELALAWAQVDALTARLAPMPSQEKPQ